MTGTGKAARGRDLIAAVPLFCVSGLVRAPAVLARQSSASDGTGRVCSFRG